MNTCRDSNFEDAGLLDANLSNTREPQWWFLVSIAPSTSFWPVQDRFSAFLRHTNDHVGMVVYST